MDSSHTSFRGEFSGCRIHFDIWKNRQQSEYYSAATSMLSLPPSHHSHISHICMHWRWFLPCFSFLSCPFALVFFTSTWGCIAFTLVVDEVQFFFCSYFLDQMAQLLLFMIRGLKKVGGSCAHGDSSYHIGTEMYFYIFHVVFVYFSLEFVRLKYAWATMK